MCVLMAMPQVALAHGGHGNVKPHMLAHYLMTPEHVIPTIGAFVALTGLTFMGFKKWRATQKEES
jgi:hypothetical protein